MRNFWFAPVIVLISMVSYSTAAADGQNFPPSKPRTVSGTQILHYKKGSVPVDLSSTTITALVPNGHGGYNVVPGTGTSSGTFSIPNVPSGFYLLQIGATYVWTNETKVDADSYANYRSDIVAVDPNTTSFTFDLTNLNSWQQTDNLEIVCPNDGTSWGSFIFDAGTTGETTFTGTYPEFSGNLSVGSEGDQYYAAQLITENLGGYPFTGLARYLELPKFTQAQGSDTPIDGELKTIAQNDKFEANINGADITAQALAANPAALLIEAGIYLDVFPGSLAHGVTTSTPDLVFFSQLYPPFFSSNGDLGQVLYGNPYSSKWPLFVSYFWGSITSYLAPRAAVGGALFTMVSGNTTTLPTSSSPIKPLVGVVNTPTVNGGSFFDKRKRVGSAPTLAWSPPTVGSANNYVVQIYQLNDYYGGTQFINVAAFYTQGTSLVLPPGLLTPGYEFVFEISADYIPGVNFAKTPFKSSSTSATAQVLSGVMQP